MASFRRDFRQVQFGIHEQGQVEPPANGQHVFFREDEHPLLVIQRLALLPHAGHVRVRLTNGV
jgi:hypothetical protein